MKKGYVFLKHNERGIDLAVFVECFKEVLKNCQLFYIVSAEMDRTGKKNNVYKIGCGGRRNGRALHVIKRYLISYGRLDPRFRCRGARIHFAYGMESKFGQDPTRALVYKIEREVLSGIENLVLPDRGNERIVIQYPLLAKRVDLAIQKVTSAKSPIKRRRSSRVSDPIQVLSQEKKNGVHLVKVRFNRAINKDGETEKTIELDELLRHPQGGKILKDYMDKTNSSFF